MYWIDVAARSINRACLNGTGKTTLIDSDMRTPGTNWKHEKHISYEVLEHIRCNCILAIFECAIGR